MKKEQWFYYLKHWGFMLHVLPKVCVSDLVVNISGVLQ